MQNAAAFWLNWCAKWKLLAFVCCAAAPVNGNNRRALSVKEFRGFVLKDEWAPMIFLNSHDSTNAMHFTLIHELAHLVLGGSGVSDVHLGEEQLCNQVAAGVLVKEADLRKRLAHCENEAQVLAKLPSLCAHFAVSEAVLAIRAKDLGFISSARCFQYVREMGNSSKIGSKASGGGDYYRNRIAAVSRSFAEEVLHSLDAEEILTRDAARLLGLKYSSLGKFRAALHTEN